MSLLQVELPTEFTCKHPAGLLIGMPDSSGISKATKDVKSSRKTPVFPPNSPELLPCPSVLDSISPQGHLGMPMSLTSLCFPCPYPMRFCIELTSQEPTCSIETLQEMQPLRGTPRKLQSPRDEELKGHICEDKQPRLLLQRHKWHPSRGPHALL